MKKLIMSSLIAVLVGFAAQAAVLGTVDIAHSGYGASNKLTLHGGGHIKAGVYILDKTDGSGAGADWLDGTIGAFSIDLMELSSSSTLTYDVLMPEESPITGSILDDLIGTAKADFLSELWGRYFDEQWLSGDSYTVKQNKHTVKQNKHTVKQNKNAAAFGAAILEIIWEDLPATPLGWDVAADGTSGEKGFHVRNADTATANTWLHSLTGFGPKADLRVFSNDGSQDFLVAVSGPVPGPIPEPATVVMFVFGGLMLLKRRAK